jgi:hypothetical protein
MCCLLYPRFRLSPTHLSLTCVNVSLVACGVARSVRLHHQAAGLHISHTTHGAAFFALARAGGLLTRLEGGDQCVVVLTVAEALAAWCISIIHPYDERNLYIPCSLVSRWSGRWRENADESVTVIAIAVAVVQRGKKAGDRREGSEKAWVLGAAQGSEIHNT